MLSTSISNEESKLMTDDSIRMLSIEEKNLMVKEFINVLVKELAKVVTQFKFVSPLTLI